jgi:hypothetical protein
MGRRSKEMGKPVEELTPRELALERQRCETLVRAYGNKIAVKGLAKPLREIEQRLTNEERP